MFSKASSSALRNPARSLPVSSCAEINTSKGCLVSCCDLQSAWGWAMFLPIQG